MCCSTKGIGVIGSCGSLREAPSRCKQQQASLRAASDANGDDADAYDADDANDDARGAHAVRVRYHTEDDGRRSKVESRHTQTIVGELGFFLDEPRYAVRSSSAVQTLMILRTGRSKRADACTRQRAHGMP